MSTPGSSRAPFGIRLRDAMAGRGPLCVGVDPHPALLHDWGLADDVVGLERFSRTVVEALAGHVAALKPQSAFFERHGSRGIAVLETVIAEAKVAGTLVIADVKRGDIGSTMTAYADAYLHSASPLCCDAMTVSPYLGVGALMPTFDLARAHGNGVFVLALTSNPEGATVQRAHTTAGVTVAQQTLNEVGEYNRAHAGDRDGFADAAGWGCIGAVVGATIGRTPHDFSTLDGPFLAPGIGAQGGNAADLAVVFGAELRAVLPSVSRTVLQAGPNVAVLQQAAARETRACAIVRDNWSTSSAG